jgi:hypothetical protein
MPARSRQKIGDPRGGWVGQRPKKDRGQTYFSTFFELPSPRNAQKLDKNKSRKIGSGFLVEFFVKALRHDVFAKRFCKTFLCFLTPIAEKHPKT